MPKPYSIDLREKVIKAYHHGKEQVIVKENTISGVAKRFDVSVKFVKNLLKLYRETGSVTPKPHGGGQTPKLSVENLKFLLDTVEKQSDLTIDEYLEIYNHSFDNQVSASTIGRALLKLNLTRKKKKLSDPRKYKVSNQLKCKLYQLALRHLDPKQLIYLDETGATINMIRDHARSLVFPSCLCFKVHKQRYKSKYDWCPRLPWVNHRVMF
jgi:transposase